jgi:hypothetical protein
MRPRPRSRSAALHVILVVPVLLAGMLTADAAGPSATRAADPGIHARAHQRPAPSHEVYGYLPYWQLGAGTARQLDYRGLSTIAFFAVPIGANGALDRHAIGYRAYVSRAARAVTNAAHAQGVRVVPTFQLFSVSKLRRLLDDRPAQARFIRQALALMGRRHADGANLDVEPVPASLASKFAAFVGRFSHQMHRRFPGSQLTVATPAIVSDRLLKGLEPVVDRFFVMTYDYHWSGSRRPGAVAPLSQGAHNVAKTIRNYLRLVPRHKLILGVPLYGYSWPVVRVDHSWRVRANPGRWGGVRAVTYASALAWLSRHPSVTVHHDRLNGSWFRYVNRGERTTRQVHFEDARSATAKFNFAIAEGLAGVGIWSLGNDVGRPGVARGIQRTFVRPTRRITARTTVRPVRLDRGWVRFDASIVLRDRGSRAERGTVTWRVVDPGGRTIESGRRVAALYPGGDLHQRIAVKLGRASSVRAGTYRLVVRFVVGTWTPVASTVRFHQPY